MLLALSDVPLRSASFALEDRWLFWSRVRVYPDRLELTGWSLAGRHQRHIPLDRLEEVDHEDRRLRFELEGGEEVSILVDRAGRWASFIEAHCQVHEDPPFS